MNAWILSIVGVVTLSVLVDILLPEGQTNKYIKGIFSVITLFVIISPLPKLISNNFDLNASVNFDAAVFEIDVEYLKGLVSNPHKIKEDNLKKYLERKGCKGAEIKIVGKTGKNTEIDYVNVYLKNATYTADKPHNLVTNEIKNLVSDYLVISKNDVRVLYE